METSHGNTEKPNSTLTVSDWENTFDNSKKMHYESVSSILLVLI